MHKYTLMWNNSVFDTNLPIEKYSSSWSFQQSVNVNWVLVIILSLVFKNLPYPNLVKSQILVNSLTKQANVGYFFQYLNVCTLDSKDLKQLVFPNTMPNYPWTNYTLLSYWLWILNSEIFICKYTASVKNKEKFVLNWRLRVPFEYLEYSLWPKMYFALASVHLNLYREMGDVWIE